jgi:copper chaperone CopZ
METTMRKTTAFGLALLALAALCLTQAPAQSTSKQTVITIEDLDCPSCAKVLEKAIAKLTGVESVKTDVEKQTATILPQDGATLSARALWEAVENAGFKPTKLEGPGGSYTAKPAT